MIKWGWLRSLRIDLAEGSCKLGKWRQKKRVTPWGLSCGTITVNEVFVGRYHRDECSRRPTRHCDFRTGLQGIARVCAGKLVLVNRLVVVATAAFICCIVPVASAQIPIDDVHVTPRIEA